MYIISNIHHQILIKVGNFDLSLKCVLFVFVPEGVFSIWTIWAYDVCHLISPKNACYQSSKLGSFIEMWPKLSASIIKFRLNIVTLLLLFALTTFRIFNSDIYNFKRKSPNLILNKSVEVLHWNCLAYADRGCKAVWKQSHFSLSMFLKIN